MSADIVAHGHRVSVTVGAHGGPVARVGVLVVVVVAAAVVVVVVVVSSRGGGGVWIFRGW